MQLWPSGPGSSWRLAVSLAFPPPPPPSVLDQHRRRQQQQPLFPGQHRLLPPAWRMWRPADSVPSMGRWLEGPSPRTSDHECEGRMKPALDSFTGDTTHLLREILQNKDKKLREQLNNNNTMKTYCSNGEVNGQEMMAAVMRSKSSGSECNSVHNDHNSVNSDERSGEESDMESAYDQAGSEELRDMEDSKRGADTPNGTASAGESGKTPDSKEAKRARVENIITSMRHSPQPGQTDHGGSTAPQELKRPKRKQLQPQQHGEAGRGPTDSKLRKTERMQLVNSIRQLQNELMAVKQRFSELEAEEEEEAEDEDETEDDKHLKEAKENGEEPYADLVRDKDDVSGCGVRDLQNGWDMFTSRVEGGGSKLLKPDSDCGSLVRPGFPFSGKEHAFHHGPFKSAFGPLTQPNFQLLASTLKTELTQSINKIVDTALVKAMDAPSAKHSSHGSGHDHSSSSNAGSNNRSNSSGSNTSNSNGSMGLGSKANGLDTGRESMISLSERRPELAVPFDGMGDSFGFGRGVEKLSAFEPLTRGDPDLHRLPHPPVPFTSSYPFYLPTHLLQPPMYPTAEPEQTEALPLVVSTPKKPKRTKVTDTRLSPRAKNSLLQDNTPSSSHPDLDRVPVSYPHFMSHMLPTSVAIPNPSLNPDLLSASFRDHCFGDLRPSLTHSPHLDRSSPHSPENSSQYGGSSKLDLYDSLLSDAAENSKTPMTSTLTPMHLRKAKLMFFFVRYPSSAILKIYFPDINFNKNNTAQLVKWFSNFREFYYIQMEKYARQAIAEGCKNAEDLVVSNDSELFRVLNLHYNRNNQIEAPESFVTVVQSTLREFYKAISTAKDSEPSWKKAIYKIIARLDDAIPEYFKSPNWMEQLGEA